jgi:hypothetical protein
MCQEVCFIGHKKALMTGSQLRLARGIGIPDRRRQIHLEVVLVRCWVIWVLGIWRGRVWGKGGIGGSAYKQPETEVDGSCHS